MRIAQNVGYGKTMLFNSITICYPFGDYMGTIWGLLIAALILGLAYLIKEFLANIIEDEHQFLYIIAGFLLVYVGAVFAMGQVLPAPQEFAQYPVRDLGLLSLF